MEPYMVGNITAQEAHAYLDTNTSSKRMAKRGRPRKRGGLAGPQATPRVPVHIVREVNEEISSPGKLIDVKPGVVEGADVFPGSTAAQIRGKGMTPLEVWGNEDGELIENQVTMALMQGSPYLRALKRDSEDLEFQLNPLAGNRDLNKGTPLSRKSTRNENIIITAEAVREELEYWENALIGYVLGDRVPFSTMEGFVRAQWKRVGQPEILLHDKGYFVF
ncbi:hypothetical protein Dimus_015117 [Dionaea muscipula]